MGHPYFVHWSQLLARAARLQTVPGLEQRETRGTRPTRLKTDP